MTKETLPPTAGRASRENPAEELGIDHGYISLLVDGFYDRVRRDNELGPVFDKVVDGNWDHHLSRMKVFWGAVALNTGAYHGSPMVKHRNLMMQTPPPLPQHFERWLSLFRQTLEETAPSPGVVVFFMERAERIAASLQLGMFGVPGIEP